MLIYSLFVYTRNKLNLAPYHVTLKLIIVSGDGLLPEST